jgi:hypothetical protein
MTTIAAIEYSPAIEIFASKSSVGPGRGCCSTPLKSESKKVGAQGSFEKTTSSFDLSVIVSVFDERFVDLGILKRHLRLRGLSRDRPTDGVDV